MSRPESTAALPPPPGLEVAIVESNGTRRLVLSFPLRAPSWPDALTAAEREVAELLLEGASNADIAERRGTSSRTVANQIAAIFRKTKVASRIELAATVFR